jgi:hypothetical protein
MSEILQILGAILILGAFALLQFRIVSQQSYPYLFLNLIGSALLTVLVFISHQWGFLLLEGAWALIALWSIITRMCALSPHHLIKAAHLSASTRGTAERPRSRGAPHDAS